MAPSKPERRAVALLGPAVVALEPTVPWAAARARQRVRDRHDPKRIRYGCFLPDLTGLATAPPTPAPRGGYIRSRGRWHKGHKGRNGDRLRQKCAVISRPCGLGRVPDFPPVSHARGRPPMPMAQGFWA